MPYNLKNTFAFSFIIYNPAALKKYFYLVLSLVLFCSARSLAINVNPHTVITSKISVDQLLVRDIVNMDAKQFSAATGHQLNLFQKIYFKLLKGKLRTAVKQHPDLLLNKYYAPQKGKFKLDGLWFIIGAIIGPLGILFAFTSKQPKSKRISAVLGTVVFILWFGLLVFL